MRSLPSPPRLRGEQILDDKEHDDAMEILYRASNVVLEDNMKRTRDLPSAGAGEGAARCGLPEPPRELEEAPATAVDESTAPVRGKVIGTG